MKTAVVLVAGLTLGVAAQQLPVDVPVNGRAFEVASVRLVEHPVMSQVTAPQVTERSITMMILLQMALVPTEN
jgi:hypothetical protein